MLSTLVKCGVLLLACAAAARAENPAIVADAIWKDSAGNEIQAQGGCVLQVRDTFFWYGVTFHGQTPAQVRCYSSKDLATWKFEAVALQQHVSRRVKVLHDPARNCYVMFTRLGTRLGVSVCAEPAGPFTWKGGSELPEAGETGDVSAFQDEDGKAYVMYPALTGGEAESRTIVLAQLNADWSGAEKIVQRLNEAPYEAPALWKRSALYYLTAAGRNGWYSSPTFYCTAPQVSGPWSAWKKISRSIMGESVLTADTYNSQHNMVFQITGTQGSLFVYGGDRWSQFTEYGTGQQVWLPLEFEDQTPVLTWYRPWHPNVAQGTFTHDLRRYSLWRDPHKKK